MRKITLILLLLTLLFAPKGFILAQEALPSSEPSQTASSTEFELPASPLDPFINEWIKGGKLQSEAQRLMNNIQNQAAEGFKDTSSQVQDAAKDEISRQVDKELNDAKQGVQGYVQILIGEVKKVAGNLVENIKTFFRNIFHRTPTN